MKYIKNTRMVGRRIKMEKSGYKSYSDLEDSVKKLKEKKDKFKDIEELESEARSASKL